MAVISLRLNQNEEKMVDYLSKYFEQDRSALIKYSLRELYEDLTDREIIDEYEKKEKENKIKFYGSDEIMKMMKPQKTAYNKRACCTTN